MKRGRGLEFRSPVSPPRPAPAFRHGPGLRSAQPDPNATGHHPLWSELQAGQLVRGRSRRRKKYRHTEYLSCFTAVQNGVLAAVPPRGAPRHHSACRPPVSPHARTAWGYPSHTARRVRPLGPLQGQTFRWMKFSNMDSAGGQNVCQRQWAPARSEGPPACADGPEWAETRLGLVGTARCRWEDPLRRDTAVRLGS